MSKLTITTIIMCAIVIAILLFSPASPISPVSHNVPTSGLPRKGVVNVNVVLSPVCPVERIPPDPNCAPKPYQTRVVFQSTNLPSSSISFTTDASGTFSTPLDPGSYTFTAQSQNNSYYPHCSTVQVQVVSEQSQTITITCDTGIR